MMSESSHIRAARSLVLLGLGGSLLFSSCSPAEEEPVAQEPREEEHTTGGSSNEGMGGGLPDEMEMDMEMDMDTEAPPLESSSRRGEVGTGCSVKNDCAGNLSCIRGICQPTSYDFSPSAKECVQVDCNETADCCGDLPLEVPEKCRSRAAKCSQTLPGCDVGSCTRSSECGGGGVCTGSCAVSSGECNGNVDCFANRCVRGACSLDFTACDSDAECALNTCVGGTCACENPAYDPADPVCMDEECEGLCTWACEDSRCVIPSDCTDSDDCYGSAHLCVEGKCVECTTGTDCSFDKICVEGRCETPCTNDLHCSIFEACEAGECIYIGCRSHRECSLVSDPASLGLPAGLDSRLLQCFVEDGVGTCVVPCQNDAQCASTEVCDAGVCRYIGCETDTECKTITGLSDQVASNEKPWIPVVECRGPDAN